MKSTQDNLRFIVNEEATLNADKKEKKIEYIVSRPGRTAIERIGITVDMKLSVSDKLPLNREYVLWIRPTTIQKIKFSDLKHLLDIETSGQAKEELIIYNTTSKKYPFAVARLGTSTTMVRQLHRVAGSKRGEHFRETAFIITLAKLAWVNKGVKIPIYSNRGLIKMDYYNKSAVISKDERGEFRNLYDEYMEQNKSTYKVMLTQCEKLIKYLGDEISNIKYITKNESKLIINLLATRLLKDAGKSTTLAKWNPSDIWIAFNDHEEDMKFNTLEELNEYLLESINNVNGLIGVSLKQGEGILAYVNMNAGRAQHSYDNFTVVGDRKTVVIDFSYKFPGKRKFVGGSTIDCRTFDTKNTSSVYLEVRGSKKAKHMSGKAGKILEDLMDPVYWEAKEFARKTTNKSKLRDYFSDFHFQNEDLKDIFFDDLRGSVKTAEQNSRLQSIIIVEWLEWLCASGGQQHANNVISQVVRYARSESDWSAPHLVVK